ncbi:hypothetical protein F4810DRAFT_685382, partial [Camillea tinctor]
MGRTELILASLLNAGCAHTPQRLDQPFANEAINICRISFGYPSHAGLLLLMIPGNCIIRNIKRLRCPKPNLGQYIFVAY